MTNLQKTVLVTGAAKRVGRAVALALAKDGWDLALHYNRSAEAASQLKVEIEALGRRAITLHSDLCQAAAAGRLVREAGETLGPLSLLINNASLMDRDRLASMTEASWRQLIDINLTAPVFLTKAFAAQPDLPEGASVINMLDQQMAAPSPRFFSYAVAKTGLEAATRLAAFDLASRNIRVNGIAPGLVLKSTLQTEEAHRGHQRRMPLGDGLGPDDIIRAVRYLIDAPYVTGEVMTVDAGQQLIGPGNSHLVA